MGVCDESLLNSHVLNRDVLSIIQAYVGTEVPKWSHDTENGWQLEKDDTVARVYYWLADLKTAKPFGQQPRFRIRRMGQFIPDEFLHFYLKTASEVATPFMSAYRSQIYCYFKHKPFENVTQWTTMDITSDSTQKTLTIVINGRANTTKTIRIVADSIADYSLCIRGSNGFCLQIEELA